VTDGKTVTTPTQANYFLVSADCFLMMEG